MQRPRSLQGILVSAAKHFLLEQDWRHLAAEHQRKVSHHTQAFRDRRARRLSHPVDDFLFTYYSYSPAKVETWHPGFGISLEATQPEGLFAESPYTHQQNRVTLDPEEMHIRRRLQWIHNLLTLTKSRRGNFSCHGLHEWAMVYQSEGVRHEKTPLRLTDREITAFVDSRQIRCSHYDAYRFFTKAAQPLNRMHPTLDSREEMEQPGCLHTNMDLYKWAYKSMPWVGSAFLWKCFLLAREIREIDMRASPYDLTGLGYTPIPIETEAGRHEYETHQKEIAARAATLRDELIAQLNRILKQQPANPLV